MARLLVLVTALTACQKPTNAPPTSPSSPVAAPCASVPAAACGARKDCAVIQGQVYDEARACVQTSAALGCHSAQDGCGDAITFARDPQGKPYLFMDTCIPAGWKSEPHPKGTSDVPPC